MLLMIFECTDQTSVKYQSAGHWYAKPTQILETTTTTMYVHVHKLGRTCLSSKATLFLHVMKLACNLRSTIRVTTGSLAG